MNVEVEVLDRVDADTVQELAALVRQLSSSAALLSTRTVLAIVEHDAMTLFVARIDRRTVGMLSLACFPTPTGLRAWIEDVVTIESARGSGVGSALVRAALDAARRNGARTVDLTSRPERDAANGLYLQLGFELRETNVYRFTLAP